MDSLTFEQLADLISDPLLLVTADGRVVGANAGAAALSGSSAGALAGASLTDLVADPAERVREQLALWARSRSPIPGSLRWRMRNGAAGGGAAVAGGGGPLELRVDGSVLRVREGDKPALLALRCRPKAEAVSRFLLLNEKVEALTREVMERRRAEEALAAEREWLRVTLASIGDAVIAMDCDDRVLYLNPVAEAMTGWPQGEAKGRPIREVFPIFDERTGEAVENPCEKVRRTGRVVGLANHTVLRGRDGVDRPIEDSAAPIRSAAGELIGVVMVFHDVTERRRSERVLREQREWLAVTLASIGDAVIATDEEGRVSFMNPVAEGLTGWPADRARGRAITEVFDIVNEYTREVVESPVARVLREGVIVGLANHTVLRRPDGTEIPIDDSGAPIRREDGDLLGAVLVFRDITERHRAEAALREREELFRSMADSAPVLIWVADASKACTFFNKPWLAYTGRTLEQEVGFGWAEGVHSEDLERCLEIYENSFDRREPFSMEYRLRGADGAYRWMLDTGVPRFASDGTFEGFIGSLVDVSEQVRARESLQVREEELNRLVEARTRALEESHHRLRLAERMASIGTLSAGLGHDMGNLLLPVRMRLDVLEASDLDEAQREDLRAVRKCTEYLQRLSNGLRMLSLSPESVGGTGAATELESWWLDVEPVLRNTLPRGVTLEKSLPAERVAVRLARHLLTQAVFNLVQNAGQAIGEAGNGKVRVWAEPAPGGATVRIGVSDNGPGMTPEVMARCLEPFFTTKTRAISTGLGLSLVQGVVSGAGGAMTIDSAPGRGATFTLTLPRASMGETSAPGEPRAGAPPASRARAVVTVADPRRRSIVESLLASQGVDVASGDGAGDDADVWITDADRSARAEAERFLAGGAGRRVIVLGAWSAGDERIAELSGPGYQSQLAQLIVDLSRRTPRG